jgi:hypothetical protein
MVKPELAIFDPLILSLLLIFDIIYGRVQSKWSGWIF